VSAPMPPSAATPNCSPQTRHDEADAGIYWELAEDGDGNLVAILGGTEPLLIITAPDLPALHKRVREFVMRGML
jgi:hypothetical protein